MGYLYFNEGLKYPTEKYAYAPSVPYPEYTGGMISVEPNKIYDAIREIFYACGLDASHYGTKEWNPLGRYIKRGDLVLIKPNWVLHRNGLRGQEDLLDQLVTHPSIIRCVLDYVLIALDGSGEVYIGDSPVKDCELPVLWKKHHYDIIQKHYEDQSNIKWVDLRGPEEERQGACPLEGVKVDLKKESYFYSYSNQKNLRIPNYDHRKVVSHHLGETQEYYVNGLVLKADVIINLPKPKTHRKSGFTGALKNFVGINYSKEYLPHHTLGDAQSGGDEFYEQTILKKHASWIRGQRDIIRTSSAKHTDDKRYRSLARYEDFIWRLDHKLRVSTGLNGVREGTWYRNDTLWRTILDLNKIVHYADAEGVLKREMQRTVIHLCDMVISGEGEGPLAPSAKKEDILLFGTNGVELDALIARLMHFDIKMLPSIRVALDDRLLENDPYDMIQIRSNLAEYERILLKDATFERFLPFRAANGWRGYIEEK